MSFCTRLSVCISTQRIKARVTEFCIQDNYEAAGVRVTFGQKVKVANYLTELPESLKAFDGSNWLASILRLLITCNVNISVKVFCC